MDLSARECLRACKFIHKGIFRLFGQRSKRNIEVKNNEQHVRVRERILEDLFMFFFFLYEKYSILLNWLQLYVLCSGDSKAYRKRFLILIYIPAMGVVELAENNRNLSMWLELATLGGLRDSMESHGDYTFFAPTNEAFLGEYGSRYHL